MNKEQLEEKLYWYKATLNYVYDGDSITSFLLNFGFGIQHQIERGEGRSIRLFGIDADRLNTDEGKAARDFLKQFEEQEVYVHSYKDKTGKFGRYLFTIYALIGEVYQDINQLMIDEGLVEDVAFE